MNQIRWGLVGCGDVARKRVAQAILDDPRSELVAACRRNETELRKFCDAFRIDGAYTDADELLHDANVEAIYIATPVREHCSLTLAAAQAGKHVLVEKPMAMSVAECDEMIAACRAANVKLGVAYYRRFYPMVHRISQLMKGGSIGTPLTVSAVAAAPLSMQPGQDGYWRAIPGASGGGALMDIGSHRINIFLHLFGELEDVRAMCETVAADYEVEDTALLLLKFRSGVTGTLQCHFGCADPDEFVITGTRGRLVARPLNGDTLIVETNGKQQVERHVPADNFCGPLIDEFVSAILEDRQPMVHGVEGRATNAVMEMAYSAAR